MPAANNLSKFFLIKNIKIGSSMLILFQVLSIALIIIFIVFMIILQRFHLLSNKILEENVSSIRAAYNVEISLLNLKGLKANYILEEDEKWLRSFNENEKNFTHWYNQAFDTAKTEAERNILSAMSIDFENYMKIHNEVIALFKGNRRKAAINLLLEESGESFDAINQGCGNLIRKNEALIHESETTAKDYLQWARYIGYSVIALFVAIGFLLALIISNSIVRPIREMERDSDSVLDAAPRGKPSGNEVERLKERFHKMIEALKANQQKMIHSEKRAAIGAVAAGISHELNNPIGIIYGFAERLLKSGKLTAAQKTDIREIYKETERCKRLLGELFDFARPMQLEFHAYSVKTLIRESVALFENQEKYRRMKFETVLPYKADKIRMDFSRMKQVLINMILNAAEAVAHAGTVRIALASDKNNLQIIIRDNGPGIQAEKRADVFKPFYSTKPKGVGLGLAVCQDIVENHGGSIGIHSNPGEFTEFVITLPKDRT